MNSQSEHRGLFPFLHGKARNPETLTAELLHSVAGKARDPRQTNEHFPGDRAGIPVGAAQMLAEVYRNKGRLFTLGNGGSGCGRPHVAACRLLLDLLHEPTADERGSAAGKGSVQ